jgi:YVTN family beta-propeller protein
MMKRQLFQILPPFFILAILIQLTISSNCYAEAFAYIPASNNDNLSIIKVLDNSITDELTVGDGPFGVAAGSEYVYVTNQSSGTASVISISFNLVIDSIVVGNSPRGITVTSDGTYIYVANY